jgi:uncharacterized protein (TIGR00299 family) protein
VTRLHVDPVTGASGDMLLGALLDAGAPLDAIRADLDRLGVPGWRLTAERVTRHGLTGTLATVRTEDTADHRSPSDLIRIVAAADLRAPVAAAATAVIERLAAAEAAIHGVDVSDVHLHEVGALDTLIDVVGVCSALDHLGVALAAGALTCAPLPTGRGTVHTRHGELPVPAPATLALLKGTGIEWRLTDDPLELVTPTGAALLAHLARPASATTIAVTATGYGFGSSTRLPRANCCRVLVGTEAAHTTDTTDTVVRLTTTLDDQSPEELAVAVEECLAAGALDAWVAPVAMKKGRLGSELTVLGQIADEAGLAEVLFVHTTTLGIRRDLVARHLADREERTVVVGGFDVRVKVRSWRGRLLGAKPELDDCVAAARATGSTVESIRRRALAALAE